jgi:hypothetical protein
MVVLWFPYKTVSIFAELDQPMKHYLAKDLPDASWKTVKVPPDTKSSQARPP